MTAGLDALRNAYDAVLDDWTESAEADGAIRLDSASPELIDERLGIGIGVRRATDGPDAIGIQIRRRGFAELSDGRRIARLQGAVDRAARRVAGFNLATHVIDVLAARFPLVSQLRKGDGGIFSHFRKQCRPLQVGASIGRADGMTGTLGCFVQYTVSGSNPPLIERGLLSCSHIMARSYESTPERRGKEGDSVYQPREPKKNPIQTHEVGKLTRRFSILSPDVNNVHDVAVARITVENEPRYVNVLAGGIEACQIAGKPLLPPGDAAVAPLMRVGKIGRSTGYTEPVSASRSEFHLRSAVPSRSPS